MSTNTSGSKRKTTGNILICIGIAGICISCAMLFTGCGASLTDEPNFRRGLLGFLGIPIFLPIIPAGLGLKKARECPTGLHFGLFSLFLPVFGIISGLLAIIFGAVALAQIKRNPILDGRTTAIAGMVIGIIGITIWTWALWVILPGFLS